MVHNGPWQLPDAYLKSCKKFFKELQAPSAKLQATSLPQLKSTITKQKGKYDTTSTINKRREETRDMRRTASQDVQEHCARYNRRKAGRLRMVGRCLRHRMDHAPGQELQSSSTASGRRRAQHMGEPADRDRGRLLGI